VARRRSASRRARPRWRAGRGTGFDLAIGHGSNDITVAAALLRVPASTAFDYEWATVQHNVNCRLRAGGRRARRHPAERLRRYGAGPRKLHQYPGLKEEYYLADFEPDESVLGELGLARERPLAVVRTPPSVSLYHRSRTTSSPACSGAARDRRPVVVLPRSRSSAPNWPASPASSCPARRRRPVPVAYADVVVSAGGR